MLLCAMIPKILYECVQNSVDMLITFNVCHGYLPIWTMSVYPYFPMAMLCCPCVVYWLAIISLSCSLLSTLLELLYNLTVESYPASLNLK